MNKTLIFLLVICIFQFGCRSDAKPINALPLSKIYVPEDYSSLAEAINIAVHGQIIEVNGGEYAGGIFVENKAITIIGIRSPIINCKNDGTNGLNILNANTTVISGVEVVNCEDGISTDSQIVVENSVFVRNVDGIDFEGGGGIVKNSRFAFNFDDGIDLDRDVDVVITDNIISNNIDDGIEVRLHAKAEIADSNIVIKLNELKNNGEAGIQLIDYEEKTGRIFYIHNNIFNNNKLANFSIMDDQNTVENLLGGSLFDPVFLFNNNFIGSNVAISAAGTNMVIENNIIYAPVKYGSSAQLNLSTSNALWGAQFNTGFFEISPSFEVKYYKIAEYSTLIDMGKSTLTYEHITIKLPFQGLAVDIGQHEVN